MYHPGKVMAVITPKDSNVLSSDSSVQAVLRMWDENLLTMAVAKPLAARIKEGDVVLADYRPVKGMSVPVPANLIVKILRGKPAEKVWQEYREVYEKKKRNERGEKQASQSYIG
jgi:hypothetical protein